MVDEEPPEDLTKQDLWNRLRRLEQRVFPSRRQLLKAGGAAALLGTGAAGGAAAAPGDDGDTVWGSSSNRDDYYVDEMDANLVDTDELSGDLTSGTTIDNLVGTGLKTSGGDLDTDGTPGAVSSIQNPSLDSNASDVETIIFRDEFFLTYQDFSDKVEVGLEKAVYDRSSNTIGDGTTDGNFSSVSTDVLTFGASEPLSPNADTLIPRTAPKSTTSTSLTSVGDQTGAHPSPDELTEAGMVPYIRLFGGLKIGDSAETASLNLKLAAENAIDESDVLTDLTTSSTSFVFVDSGYERYDNLSGIDTSGNFGFVPRLKTSNSSFAAEARGISVDVRRGPP